MSAKTFLAGWLLSSLLVLAACDTLMGGGQPPPNCPRPAIYPETAKIKKFREGKGRDIIDVVFEGEITGFNGGCKQEINEKTSDGFLMVEISVDFIAERGAANRDRKANFNYFVTVTDKGQNILSKGVFDVEINFLPNRSRAAFTDNYPPVSLEIPLKKDQTGNDFNIFIGFQLTSEELEFNRRQGYIAPGKQ